MEFRELQKLLQLVDKSELSEVILEQKDFKIKIRKGGKGSQVIYASEAAMPVVAALPVAQAPQLAAAPAVEASPAEAASPAASTNEHIFKSPMIGTFYRSSSPEVDAFVKVGDQVSTGQTVCIVEAMKLFNEIESEVSGKIIKILVEDSQPVEYEQPLFIIELD